MSASDEHPEGAASSSRDERALSKNAFAETAANNPGSPQAFFRIENWYPLIRELTPAIETVPMSRTEAKALTRYKEISQTLLMSDDLRRQEEAESAVEIGRWDQRRWEKIDLLMQEHMDPEQLDALNGIISKLDSLIEGFGRQAFVKLSTRSPKDAVLYGEPVKRHIRQLLKDSKAVAGSPEAEEEDMIAFTRAISWAMRVSSGREAVQLLLRSHRVFQDLVLGELLADDPQQFSTFLVVRPWVAMLPEWEFRCFVSGHRLTTCTQYYPDCFVSQISSQRDAIKARIMTFWEQRVRHLIPEHVPDYTMDLVLSPDLEQVLIVELNNPPPVAGTSLFSWDCAADRTLISSSPELHFRCLSSVPPDVKSRIHPPLKDLLLHLRGQHDPHAGPWDISCDHCHQPLSTDAWHFCVDCGDFELCQPCFQQHATTHPHSNWALAAYQRANSSSSSSTSSSSSDSCFIL